MDCKKLIIDKIPKSFNEGLFCGNGCIGTLIYVIGNSIRISVDHSGLWETRDSQEDIPKATFQQIIADKERYYSGEYFAESSRIYRTRLPGLSLNILFGAEVVDFYGETDLTSAVSNIKARLNNGQTEECAAYIDSNVNVLKIDINTSMVDLKFFGWDTSKLSRIKEWGYPPFSEVKNENISHIIQRFSENSLAVMSVFQTDKSIYVTLEVKTVKDRDELIESNTKLLKSYAENENIFKQEHIQSWREYWDRFDVSIPNERLQHAFYLEMYKIYCNERKGSLPVSLQGIWNNDIKMPAWCGDWHNDMNVQACYWPAYKTNNIELAEAYINYYSSIVPRLEERAEKLFGIKNAIHIPVMMGPNGYAAGTEWCFWNTLLGPELFVATDFCWYYEFSRNHKYLENKIYPFIEKVLNLYIGIVYSGDDGRLHVPFTNSPEVFKDGLMLFSDDSTFTISTLHYLLGNMQKYAKIICNDAAKWQQFDEQLVVVKTTDKGYPLFSTVDIFESHRHFCQMFPVYPLGTDAHSETANKSLDAIVDLGFTEYAAWSFPYLSILASRCGRGNMSGTLLELFCMAFRTNNTFAVNGDTNKNGLLKISDTNAGESSDAFTLEAGFIMAAAIAEMFVHRINDTIYIGCGLPDEWKQCSCKNLTIEGGHKVSVSIDNYSFQKIEILADCDENIIVCLNKHLGKQYVSYNVSLVKGQVYCIEA